MNRDKLLDRGIAVHRGGDAYEWIRPVSSFQLPGTSCGSSQRRSICRWPQLYGASRWQIV